MNEIKIHPLKQARKKLRIKQQILADLTGLSIATIKRAEGGESLSLFSISQICEYFTRRYGRQVEAQELGLQESEEIVTVPPNSAPLLKERDGCFSFGKLKTIWKVIDGDGTGMYLPQHIRSHYIPFPEELPEELQAKRSQIQQEQEQKKEQGLPFFWNGEIYSLDRFVIGREPTNEGMTLDLWFRPSDYYTFLATNMSLKEPEIRKKYLQGVNWYETVPYFSHSFGVSLVVVTADGYTLLTQKGKSAVSLPNTYDVSVIEGLNRPLDHGTNSEAPDIYRCACRGLSEELGVKEGSDFFLKDITFLSFAVNTQHALWALRGMVKIQNNINDLVAFWDNGVRDKFENQEIFPVPFTPEDVASFVSTHQPWAPGPTLYHALVHEFGREKVDKTIAQQI